MSKKQKEFSSLCILRWFCPPNLYEEIEGDLIQKFRKDVRERGERKAKGRLLWNVICFFRPGIILRNRFSVEFIHVDMLKSYLILAFRHIKNSKVFSVLNVFGLAMGITSAFLILAYVNYEMSYDQFHEDHDRIFRINYSQRDEGGHETTSAKNFIGLRPLIQDQLKEVEAVTAFSRIPANTGFLFHYREKMFYEYGSFFHADSNFFKVFPGMLKKGNPLTVLNDPLSLVLSEEVAKKIFGEEDPINKRVDGFQVTGILADVPKNSHFEVSFIAPLNKKWETPDSYWEGPYRYVYVKIKDEISPVRVEEKLNQLARKVNKANVDAGEFTLSIQPITDIHLNSHRSDELKANGNQWLVHTLIGIAIIVLLMAWINYINLEAARLQIRAREIGVRRIIGSAKWDLSIQFLTEFFCINLMASILAIIMLKILLPQFADFTGLDIDLQLFKGPIWWIAIVLFLLGSLAAGLYPPLLLSRISLIFALQGKLRGIGERKSFTKGLVVFQFTVSAVLIGFVLIVYSQTEMMRTADKKIDLEHVISIRNPTAYSVQEEQNEGEGGYQNFMVLKNKLLLNPMIKSIASSSAIPGVEIGFTYMDMIKRHIGDPYDPTQYKVLFVDYNFIPVYALKLKAGRNYSQESGADKNWRTIILNEKSVKALGFVSAHEAVGQEIEFMAVEEWSKYKIIGVVEDYYHEAPKKEISPMILFLNHNKGQQLYYTLRLTAGSNTREAITSIEKTWKEIFPQKPFEYFFLDEYYDQQFKFEWLMGEIFMLFAGVAIIIACLGVFGLTLLEVRTRLKEICIRKVLGASVPNLIAFISQRHLRIVLSSSLLSIPLLYFIAIEWLSSYPIRITVSPFYFLIPFAFILFMVAFVSMFQTFKAASTNPVEHLKHE